MFIKLTKVKKRINLTIFLTSWVKNLKKKFRVLGGTMKMTLSLSNLFSLKIKTRLSTFCR